MFDLCWEGWHSCLDGLRIWLLPVPVRSHDHWILQASLHSWILQNLESGLTETFIIIYFSRTITARLLIGTAFGHCHFHYSHLLVSKRAWGILYSIQSWHLHRLVENLPCKTIIFPHHVIIKCYCIIQSQLTVLLLWVYMNGINKVFCLLHVCVCCFCTTFYWNCG